MTAEKMADIHERLNHTVSMVVSLLTNKLLAELAANTSVRWPSGRTPTEWRPRKKSYLAFDMMTTRLTFHPIASGSLGGKLVKSEEFVQTVAVFCPRSCKHNE